MYGLQTTLFVLKCPDIYMILSERAYVKGVKYSGVTVCNDMKNNEDILKHIRKFYARSNNITRKFNHCSIGIKLRVSIYCSQLWIKVTYVKAKVAYNNMHRQILGYTRVTDGIAQVACLL